ncbi:MAG: hypothetical protein J5798_06300 [Spirochaetaceae bacterium]|nr:hypothetical protein [Spirochaetaceae bacterium]
MQNAFRKSLFYGQSTIGEKCRFCYTKPAAYVHKASNVDLAQVFQVLRSKTCGVRQI